MDSVLVEEFSTCLDEKLLQQLVTTSLLVFSLNLLLKLLHRFTTILIAKCYFPSVHAERWHIYKRLKAKPIQMAKDRSSKFPLWSGLLSYCSLYQVLIEQPSSASKFSKQQCHHQSVFYKNQTHNLPLAEQCPDRVAILNQ